MLRETLPLGRIAGIRLGAHWSVLATLAVFAWILHSALDGHGGPVYLWIVAAAGAVVLFATLAGHELAHSIVARRHGVRVERIVFWLLGGASELADEPPDARTDLWIALAGPLASLATAVVAFAASILAAAFAPDGAVTLTLVWLAVMNIVLAVFNMLPGAPLDGGRVLRAVVWWRTGDRLRAATVAARSGRWLGTILIMLGVLEIVSTRRLDGLWPMLLGWFLRTSAGSELAVAGLRHRLGDSTVGEVMSSPVVAVPGRWSVDDLLRSEAASGGHRIFPVVDETGRPSAIAAWPDLARTPAPARGVTPVAAIARNLPPGAVVTADTPLADAATRVVLRPDLDAITVVDGQGRLIGIVTATDMATACDRSALGLPIGRTDR
ncbi:site-2 protease family protein [Nocardia sp. alder85J]|uniref:site-2 protease family protein n=1 Tax=Nocardia sp. alder85J TaxID=2862949 RepID=UPI001CD2AF0C|nr:site-2 protease family protein [Nocardia sp. alder85J]MCX4092444.1 site-2 protease family protein [Nocardia sp. alder85J]